MFHPTNATIDFIIAGGGKGSIMFVASGYVFAVAVQQSKLFILARLSRVEMLKIAMAARLCAHFVCLLKEDFDHIRCHCAAFRTPAHPCRQIAAELLQGVRHRQSDGARPAGARSRLLRQPRLVILASRRHAVSAPRRASACIEKANVLQADVDGRSASDLHVWRQLHRPAEEHVLHRLPLPSHCDAHPLRRVSVCRVSTLGGEIDVADTAYNSCSVND